MGERKLYWLKIESDFFDLKEVKKMRSIPGGDTYVCIYLEMLLRSLKNGGKLLWEGVDDDFPTELALDLREPVEAVKGTCAILKRFGLLSQVSENEFLMEKVPSMTGQETQAAERMRRLRERQRNLIAEERNDVTQESNNVTAELRSSYVDIDIDIDKEIDKDKDKEIERDIEVEDKKPKRKRFIPPTVSEVSYYCRERQNSVDPEKFVDYYESNGWKVGKNPMKDWKAAVRTWERSSYKKQSSDDWLSKWREA